ncbi:MAG: hypothetical protein OHK0053_38010 [Microscillaceae bacterium]
MGRKNKFAAKTPEQIAVEKKVKAAVKARNEQKKEEEYGWFGSKTYLGMGYNFLKDRVGYGDSTVKSEGDLKKRETSGDYNKSFLEENEQKDEQEAKELLGIKKIEITLKEAEWNQEIGGMGEASAKAGLKGNVEGLEGELEAKIEMGKGGSIGNLQKMDYAIGGNQLTAGSTATGFVGAQAETKGKASASYDLSEANLSAKLSALAGLKVESTTEIALKTGDGQEMLKTSATVGVVLGVGGEAQFLVKWENGTFNFGAKATASAGWGFSGGISLQLNVVSFLKGLWNWLKSFSEWADDLGEDDDLPLIF